MTCGGIEGVSGSALSCCYRLLALSRDLFQANDLKSVLDLMKPAISELLAPRFALLIADLDGQDKLMPLDPGANPRVREQGSGLYQLIRQRAADFDEDGLMTLHNVQLPGADDTAPTISGTAIAVSFPPANPVGILTAFWGPPIAEEELRVKAALLRTLSELVGAALGNVVAKLLLRERVAESEHAVEDASRKAEDASRRFADELHQREAAMQEKDRIAVTDVLTGMLNRRGFFERAEQALKLARRNKMACAVIFADVDGLKTVNDRLGHDTGDRLLRAAGQVFSSSFRESDVVARLGGDEFAAFAIDVDEPGSILARIAESIERFHRTVTTPYRISFSVGVAECDLGSDLLLGHYLTLADKKMYQQKKTRRGDNTG